jgi:methylated-DNA-[protein]-cysteine S-methyltransferase
MPKAVRAVGHANGSNPISVVVPCHRLIGANGSLVKYGGGLARSAGCAARGVKSPGTGGEAVPSR